MVAFVGFASAPEYLNEGVINLETDTFKVALTNTAPVAATNTVLADITQVANGGGYATGGSVATVTSSSTTAGVYKLVMVDVTFTGTGAGFGPFRYAVLYSDTPTSPADPLIGYWDNGSSISRTDTQTFKVDFDATAGVIQSFWL
jgi:hypothetical protein